MMLASLREAAAPVLGLEPEQVDVRIEAAEQSADAEIVEEKQSSMQKKPADRADVSASAPSAVASLMAPALAPRQASLPLPAVVLST